VCAAVRGARARAPAGAGEASRAREIAGRRARAARGGARRVAKRQAGELAFHRSGARGRESGRPGRRVFTHRGLPFETAGVDYQLNVNRMSRGRFDLLERMATCFV